jgi:MoxR-like ATPase
MKYKKLFDWKALELERGVPSGGVAYVYDEPLELAVNVALASGRPLLLSGEPGSGKSTLAADVAWKLNRRFYTDVITSRTQAQDLLWSFDAVGRLARANTKQDVSAIEQFVQPGVLWRAFQPKTAAQHGKLPVARAWGDEGEHAVVLLDEVDKADPDIPNDLLGVLDQREFRVTETDQRVAASAKLEVLVVLSTNGERDLPPAFLRRCVAHHIAFPTDPEERAEHMRVIVRKHFSVQEVSDDLLAAVIGLFGAVKDSAELRRLRAPSTAELIDALRACVRLGVKKSTDPAWERIATVAMWKHPTKSARPEPEKVVAAQGQK